MQRADGRQQVVSNVRDMWRVSRSSDLVIMVRSDAPDFSALRQPTDYLALRAINWSGSRLGLVDQHYWDLVSKLEDCQRSSL